MFIHSGTVYTSSMIMFAQETAEVESRLGRGGGLGKEKRRWREKEKVRGGMERMAEEEEKGMCVLLH